MFGFFTIQLRAKIEDSIKRIIYYSLDYEDNRVFSCIVRGLYKNKR